MNRLTTILLLMLFASFVSFSVFAGTPTPPAITGGFSIIGKNKENKKEDFQYQMGKNLPIKVTGTYVKNIEQAWKDNKSIALYFDGDKVAILESPPEKITNETEIQLTFTLARNADEETSRKLWDDFFKKRLNHHALMEIKPSIAIGNDLPVAVTPSPYPFKFYVTSGKVINSVLMGGIAILLFTLFVLIRWTNMLKDVETNYYSLGKTQMAFWGLLVVVSFVGIWIVTGSMEHIPSQILILIGISGGTGLSAVIIGNGKRIEKQTQLTIT